MSTEGDLRVPDGASKSQISHYCLESGEKDGENSPVCGNTTAAHSVNDLVGQCRVGNDAHGLGVEFFDESV